MASRKEEIRKQLKKERQKEIEALGLNADAEIIDLNDQSGENIVVENFEGSVKKTNQKVEFNTTPQTTKRGLFGSIKYAFSEDNKILKRLDKQADQVLALESKYQNMSDDELKNQTLVFKDQIAKGKTLDDLLIEAYAVVREAAYRVLGLKAFKVQIMGAMSLHEGDIAEMKTGEGKTLTSVFPVYLNALTGKGVHVVTVNDYLAERDKTENGKVLQFLGLSVGLNKRELSKDQKRAQHACDVTYTTNAELGFDYLRDNMVTRLEDKVLRELNFALVDEVDSILIDESRTPLIISGGKKNVAVMYIQADKFVKSLKQDVEYEVDIETKSVTLTAEGIAKAEKNFRIENLYDIEHTALVHHINQALKANYTMSKDVDYLIATQDGSKDIRNASIMIIDQFTGRVMPGRAFSDGLHQALEAKEGVPIKEETVTWANITYQNFFRLFNKLAGMTGTAKTEEEEFKTIYNMRVIEIPTNRPVIRDDKSDLVYAKQIEKYNAICDEVVRRHSYGQPILLGTVSVETSEILSKMLSKRKIRHNVLNAKNHAKEAEIIQNAGLMGAVTIATNMAGRGTDIKLGEGVAEIGGLMVIGSERHESRRIDNQLRGRSGRQGDPGCSLFFVSFEDELMQRFAGDRLQQFSGAFLEGEAIESKMVTKSIESAQKRVEGQNFDIRKQLLQYDDVMRQQREIMYKERDEIMSEADLGEIIQGLFRQAVQYATNQYITHTEKNDVVDVENALKYISKRYMLLGEIVAKNKEFIENNPEQFVKSVSEIIFMQYQNRFNKELPPEVKLDYERRNLLGVIDRAWINHIDAMAKLRNGIYLRAYAQKDPLQEYTDEAFYMFEQMTKTIAEDISRNIVRMGIAPGKEEGHNIPAVRLEVEFK